MESPVNSPFNELSYYTLGHPDTKYFIHQHIVDAYQAQIADTNAKPISLFFSLIGLYLYINKNYSGRQIQLAHMELAKNKKTWPPLNIPERKGEITASHVLQATPGPERDLMIKKWCISVWQAYENCHETIALFVKKELGV
ncbi:MAG TPA: DUF5946 family protein [Chitinophagaceae bacterium]|nr:DUF5946 family protein [Chitinophagaceae bacterium]